MVNGYKLKLTILQKEILNKLFENFGMSLNQRELSKKVQVSAPAVKKALPFLENQDLIKIKKDSSGRLIIEINSENQKVMQLKRVTNLNQIYFSGLTNFLDEKFAGATIILFGSYSKGEDTINSDIDIAIIGRKQKNIDLEGFENILKRKIILQFYNSFKAIHKNLKENILNGIILSGSVEL